MALLVTFAELFAWQVRRATSGNELSWVYVFEWPIFALYAIYMWWKLVHELPAGVGAPGAHEAASDEAGPGKGPAPGSPEEDEELAAYNRYLAELNESGRPKRW